MHKYVIKTSNKTTYVVVNIALFGSVLVAQLNLTRCSLNCMLSIANLIFLYYYSPRFRLCKNLDLLLVREREEGTRVSVIQKFQCNFRNG